MTDNLTDSVRPNPVIVVADDERHVVRLAQMHLERAGYTVVTAFDGREALEKVASAQPDLLILDVMMPYLDGFAVLQELRKSDATRDLPVILLGARPNDHDVPSTMRTAEADIIYKPFNPAELNAFVTKILEETSQNKPIV